LVKLRKHLKIGNDIRIFIYDKWIIFTIGLMIKPVPDYTDEPNKCSLMRGFITRTEYRG